MAERNGGDTAREQGALEITRRWDAPPERVWQAWTDPQALSRWFGPGEEQSVTNAQLDVRPGGAYSIAFRTPDGEQHRVFGVYDEVVVNRKLSFSWAWQSTPERVSFVCIELEQQEGGTVMRFRHDRFFDKAALDNHTRGWTAALAKLDRFITAGV
jgi:uncharacterized protein YndB with AHSA1/START domain